MAAGSTRSTTSVIEASATSSGSLEAIFSSARRSPAATSSACLRSVMSMMLARIRLPLELGRRTKRTSLGISLPSASLCSHSKTGVSPPERRLDVPARDAERRRAVGLLAAGSPAPGPTRSRSSRDILKKSAALSLQSTKRPDSTSSTTTASGAFSTSTR